MNNNEKEFIDTIESAEHSLDKIITNSFDKIAWIGIDSVAESHAAIAYGLMLQAQNHLKIAYVISERIIFEREMK